MASDQEFVDYVCEQLRDVNGIRNRKMFGEYAVYVGDKVVALVCDNQLFVRPTAPGRALLAGRGALVEGSPYPGAKAHLKIEGELDDTEFMAQLILATEAELPVPKAKKPKKPKEPKKPVKAPKGKKK